MKERVLKDRNLAIILNRYTTIVASGLMSLCCISANAASPITATTAPLSNLNESSVLTPTALDIDYGPTLDFATRPDPTLIPFKISQNGLLGRTVGTASNLGVGFVYFTPGTGQDLAGNSLALTALSTYGFTDNLQLFAPNKSATFSGLNLQGQFFLSGGSQAVNSTEAASHNQQAYSQTASFSSGKVSVTASVLNIDKNFTGGTALTNALQSSDPSTVALAQAMISHIGQNSSSFGLGLGDAASGILSYKFSDSLDSVASTDTNDNLLNYNRAFRGGLNLGITDDQSSAATNGIKTDTSTQSFKLASAAVGSRLGFDIEDKLQSDNQGNIDRHFDLAGNQKVDGFALGLSYGMENVRSATNAPNNIQTVQYTASKTITPTSTFSANWTNATNSSQTGNQHDIGTGTVNFSVAPVRRLTLQTQYASNSGNSTRMMSAAYLLPNLMGLLNEKLNLSLSTCGGTSATTTSRKLAIDAEAPGQKDAFLKMFSNMNVHLEDDQALQSAINSTSGADGRSYVLGLCSSPTAFKTFRWDYKLIENDQFGGNAPTSRSLDLTVPVGTVTVGYTNDDQIPQADGTFQDTKLQDIKLATPLPDGKMTVSTDYSATTDYHASICHTNALGFTVTGATGTNQRLNFGLALQSSNTVGTGDTDATTYTFGYHLNHDAQNTIDLDSTVTTHASSTVTAGPTNIDSTVQMSYKHAF